MKKVKVVSIVFLILIAVIILLFKTSTDVFGYSARIERGASIEVFNKDIGCLCGGNIRENASTCFSDSFSKLLSNYRLKASTNKLVTPKGFQLLISKFDSNEERLFLKTHFSHLFLPFFFEGEFAIIPGIEKEDFNGEELISLNLKLKGPFLSFLKRSEDLEDYILIKFTSLFSQLGFKIIVDGID